MSYENQSDLDTLDILRNVFALDGTVVQDNLVIRCPNPNHFDEDPSCYVLLNDKSTRKGDVVERGSFHCFACGAKGGLIKLGGLVLGVSRSDVKKLLEPNNAEAKKAVLSQRLRSLEKAAEASESDQKWKQDWLERPWLEEGHRELDSYEDGPLTYLYERGFKPKLLKKWGVRYVSRAELSTKKGRATISRSIALPICDRSGLLLAWAYRRTEDSESWQPRYLYTHGSPRSEVIVGSHLVKTGNVVLAEGQLDAIWITQAGIPACALGGTGIDPLRLQALLSDYRSVTLFMDRDKPGQIATWQIGEALSEIIPVHVVRYPKHSVATDPPEMSEEEIQEAVERAIPFPAWSLRLALKNRSV